MYKKICQINEVEILAGHVGSDHIHLLVSVPPHLSVRKLVQYLKGNSSRKLQMDYNEIRQLQDNLDIQDVLPWSNKLPDKCKLKEPPLV